MGSCSKLSEFQVENSSESWELSLRVDHASVSRVCAFVCVMSMVFFCRRSNTPLGFGFPFSDHKFNTIVGTVVGAVAHQEKGRERKERCWEQDDGAVKGMSLLCCVTMHRGAS